MKSAVIVAAGNSSRYGENKMFADILGRPLIAHTVDKFCGAADEIILVVSAADKDQMSAIFGDNVRYAVGGETRTRSVLSGLMCLDPNCESVAVHDGARPFVSKKLVQRCFETAAATKSAVPVLQSTDTVLLGNAPLDRGRVYFVQTPQVYDARKLKQAYAKFPDDQTDDSQVWQKAYGSPTYVEGERTNAKITYPSDILRYKVGYGYDIHRLAPNRPLVLGGVRIPFQKGLLGHSDADALTHSVMDALLSAAGEKDIGQLFPNSDPAYKNIDSLVLLREVMEILFKKNIGVDSVSAAVVCEKPKLAGYIGLMRQTLADAMGISPLSVNISATTAEGVGEIGRGRAIAARTTALVVYQ